MIIQTSHSDCKIKNLPGSGLPTTSWAVIRSLRKLTLNQNRGLNSSNAHLNRIGMLEELLRIPSANLQATGTN